MHFKRELTNDQIQVTAIWKGRPYPKLLLLLLLSCLSRVRLCVTPETAAHQSPPSLGFSRQEPWSGLPFPSPMHDSEKWKWSQSVVSNSLRLHGLQPTRLLRPWDFPGRSTGVECHCLLHTLGYILKVERTQIGPWGRGKYSQTWAIFRYFKAIQVCPCRQNLDQ